MAEGHKDPNFSVFGFWPKLNLVLAKQYIGHIIKDPCSIGLKGWMVYFAPTNLIAPLVVTTFNQDRYLYEQRMFPVRGVDPDALVDDATLKQNQRTIVISNIGVAVPSSECIGEPETFDNPDDVKTKASENFYRYKFIMRDADGKYIECSDSILEHVYFRPLLYKLNSQFTKDSLKRKILVHDYFLLPVAPPQLLSKAVEEEWAERYRVQLEDEAKERAHAQSMLEQLKNIHSINEAQSNLAAGPQRQTSVLDAFRKASGITITPGLSAFEIFNKKLQEQRAVQTPPPTDRNLEPKKSRKRKRIREIIYAENPEDSNTGENPEQITNPCELTSTNNTSCELLNTMEDHDDIVIPGPNAAPICPAKPVKKVPSVVPESPAAKGLVKPIQTNPTPVMKKKKKPVDDECDEVMDDEETIERNEAQPLDEHELNEEKNAENLDETEEQDNKDIEEKNAAENAKERGTELLFCHIIRHAEGRPHKDIELFKDAAKLAKCAKVAMAWKAKHPKLYLVRDKEAEETLKLEKPKNNASSTKQASAAPKPVPKPTKKKEPEPESESEKEDEPIEEDDDVPMDDIMKSTTINHAKDSTPSITTDNGQPTKAAPATCVAEKSKSSASSKSKSNLTKDSGSKPKPKEDSSKPKSKKSSSTPMPKPETKKREREPEPASSDDEQSEPEEKPKATKASKAAASKAKKDPAPAPNKKAKVDDIAKKAVESITKSAFESFAELLGSEADELKDIQEKTKGYYAKNATTATGVKMTEQEADAILEHIFIWELMKLNNPNFDAQTFCNEFKEDEDKTNAIRNAKEFMLRSGNKFFGIPTYTKPKAAPAKPKKKSFSIED